jgi:hypothetical protein
MKLQPVDENSGAVTCHFQLRRFILKSADNFRRNLPHCGRQADNGGESQESGGGGSRCHKPEPRRAEAGTLTQVGPGLYRLRGSFGNGKPPRKSSADSGRESEGTNSRRIPNAELVNA